MEKQITCAGCKKNIAYQLAFPIALHCNACMAVFSVQLESGPTYVKKYYTPPPDRSVLKLNTTGNYLGKRFELIGRIRNVNTFAISNDWLMYFQDGTYMWLTECNLSYFVVSTQSVNLNSIELKGKKAGRIIKIKDQEYRITEISKQLQMEIEGELPMDAYTDEQFFKYELIGLQRPNEFATIILYEKDILETFLSKEVTLSSLKLEGINEFKDWK
jgi:hypothetical protein